MSDEVLTKTLDGNFWALHVLSQRLLTGMRERRCGRIINIGRISAHFGSGVYHSCTLSKTVAMQYIRNIAVEYGEVGVRANSLTRTGRHRHGPSSDRESPDVGAGAHAVHRRSIRRAE